jgi:hypothetical protein
MFYRQQVRVHINTFSYNRSGNLVMRFGSVSPFLVLLMQLVSLDARMILSQEFSKKIVVVQMSLLPSTEIALHMPCNESNFFATKCMCHIQCTSAGCANAISLCSKYSTTRGCKYVLLREIGKKLIATLKRTPSTQELDNIDISSYPTTIKQLTMEPWKSIVANEAKSGNSSRSSSSIPLNNLDYAVSLIDTASKALISDLNMPNGSRETALCGGVETPFTDNYFHTKTIALVLLSYKTPRTLLNTLKTWKSSGLLEMAHERIAILSKATPTEIAIAASFGFEIVQPKDIPDAKVMAPNLLTIGAAFYYGLSKISSDYVLFLENDFKMDTSLSKKEIALELLGGAGMLDRGAQVVRLMSRKYQGCGTFKGCNHGSSTMRSPSPDDRRRNWYSFYCRGYPGTAPFVNDCLSTPAYRCFTSWDSNWSLNAALLKRSDMFDKKYKVSSFQKLSLAEIGLSCFRKQDRFETVMIHEYKWAYWKVPICISYNGLFVHEEIETNN